MAHPPPPQRHRPGHLAKLRLLSNKSVAGVGSGSKKIVKARKETNAGGCPVQYSEFLQRKGGDVDFGGRPPSIKSNNFEKVLRLIEWSSRNLEEYVWPKKAQDEERLKSSQPTPPGGYLPKTCEICPHSKNGHATSASFDTCAFRSCSRRTTKREPLKDRAKTDSTAFHRKKG